MNLMGIARFLRAIAVSFLVGSESFVLDSSLPCGAKPGRRARGDVHGPRRRGGSRLRTEHDGQPAGEAGSRRVQPHDFRRHGRRAPAADRQGLAPLREHR